MRFRKNDEAVSPVIGVILMVAITVILAAVIAAFVFGMGPPKQAPQVSLKITSTSASADSINITHTGGDAIDLNKIKAIIENNNTKMIVNPLANSTTTIQTGDEIGFFYSQAAGGDTVLSINKGASAGSTITTPLTGTTNLAAGKVTVTFIDTDSSQQVAVMTATVT